MNFSIALMLAAAADISAVPADFVKYFVMMCAAGLGMWYTHKRGMRASGTRSDPVSIAQPLEIQHKARYAHKEEVEKVNLEVKRIIEAGDERQEKIIEAIGNSERRLLSEVKDLHVRLNPVAEASKEHAALLDQINHRLTNHERLRQEESHRIHQRIDDAIRLSTAKK